MDLCLQAAGSSTAFDAQTSMKAEGGAALGERGVDAHHPPQLLGGFGYILRNWRRSGSWARAAPSPQ